MKIFELFAGYGGASFALKKAKIDFECVGFSEVDPKCNKCKTITHHSIFSKDGIDYSRCDICNAEKLNHASNCYKQNHKGENFGDITKINELELPDFDLLTGGFPCQAFSVAGKGLGELESRGTLFWEILRILKHKKPKYALLENVKGITNKKHIKTFKKILKDLDECGYNVCWKILNSRDHGIPQNRERVWLVCIRKDVKQDFEFPEKEGLEIFLKDVLEEGVDKKYYLKESQVDKLINTPKTSYCIDANYAKGGSQEQYLKKSRRQIVKDPFIAASRGRNTKNTSGVGDELQTEQRFEPRPDGTSNTITSVQKDNYVCCIDDTQGFDGVRTYHDSSPTLRSSRSGIKILEKSKWRNPGNEIIFCGYVDKNKRSDGNTDLSNSHRQQNRIYNTGGIFPTLSAQEMSGRNNIYNGMTIRRLTPRECFRLMGFLEDEINIDGISNSQQYKMAGNGWDVNVVGKIFNNLFK